MTTSFERFSDAVGCRSQKELADMLGVRQALVVDARKRDSIPASWLRRLQCARGVNPHWVLTGEGPKYMNNFCPWLEEPPPAGVAAALPGEGKEEPANPLRAYSSRALAEELLRRAIMDDTL